MNMKLRLVTVAVILAGLVGGVTGARAQDSDAKIKELEARIARLEERIATLEKTAGKSAATAAKQWTVAEIKAAVTGKTTAEVRSVLGPPDQIQNSFWGYAHLAIADPDSGTELNVLVLEWVGGKASVFQLKKG